MNKSRVEAITDGIVAIAATIMVLELAIPSITGWSGVLEIKHTFFAYLVSFFMIYIVWSMHHDLFQKAEVISRRAFMINGIWIFFLTLVPFTTSWVGTNPETVVPEFFYPMNLLLWTGSFQWLDYQITKDNPESDKTFSTSHGFRLFMYGTFIVCIILSFIKPIISIYVIGFATLIMIIWTFFSFGKKKKSENSIQKKNDKE